jgi:cytochrome P450 family 619
MHVAERSIFLNLARLLWGFNIQQARDANGNIIPIDFSTDGLVPGALSNVKPFKCCKSPHYAFLTESYYPSQSQA